MVSFVNNSIFWATTTGTGSFTAASAVQGFQMPAAAGAVDGQTYRYRAQNADNSQWEIGTALCGTNGTVFTRTPLRSSNSDAVVNFTTIPTVALSILFDEDFQNADNITGGSQTGTGALVRATAPTIADAILSNPTITGASVSFDDGTVGAPSIFFAADPDTGLYRIGANNLGISAGGAKILDISASGLAVTSTLQVTGNVGIGTVAPDALLTVNANTAAADAPFAGTICHFVGSTGSTVVLADGYGGSFSFFGRRANGTQAAKTALASGDNLMQFAGYGYYVTGGPAYTNTSKVSMQFKATEAWTSTTTGTAIVFNTCAAGGTTLAEAARISGPNVGINNTDPKAYLSFGNNVATGFLDTFSKYQVLFNTQATAAGSYGIGIKALTMMFNAGGGVYEWQSAAAATTMTLSAAGSLSVTGSVTGATGLIAVSASNGITLTTGEIARNHANGSLIVAAGSGAGNQLTFRTAGADRFTLTDTTSTFGTNTASTSTTTGALVVTGGVGIGGKLFVGGNVVAQNQFFSIGGSTVYANAISYASGQGVYWLGASNSATPDLIFSNNAGTSRMTLSDAGVLALSATTASTSTTTGALTVGGGAGIAGRLNVGGMSIITPSATGNPAGSGTTQAALILRFATNPGATLNNVLDTGGYNNHATFQYGMWLQSGNQSSLGADNAIPLVLNPLGNDVFVGGVLKVAAITATPAGGSTSARLLFGTTAGFGIYYGSGAPTVSAASGSIYIRTDNAGANLRLYSNTTGSTTWAAITSA